MKSDHVKFRRAPETKFLSVDQDVFDKLSPYALKVYGQLRKLTSFTKENDETEITVKNLASASGISERKTYDCLNELEYEHYIIQRHNIYHIRYGQINTFDVSQTYGCYKPVQTETSTAPDAPPVDNFGQNLSPTAPRAVPPAQYAVPSAPNADLYKEHDLSHEVSTKKQNKKTVFSDTDSVKTHLTLVANKKGQFLEDDTVEQIIFYVGKSTNYDDVAKKINIALKLIRENKWNIPQGWNGISSQSIRDKEEAEQRAKQEQYKQEAQAFRNVTQAVSEGKDLQGWKNVLNQLKGVSNGKDANEGGMPEKAVSSGN